MIFRPVNGYILVEKKQEEQPDSLVLVPTNYVPKGENFVKLKVLSESQYNPLNIFKYDYVLTREAMVEEVNIDGHTYYLLLKNHILGIFRNNQLG